MSTTIQLRRDTAANWTTANPALAAGEIGIETDTGKIKIGDGATLWNALGYGPAIAAGSVTNAMLAADVRPACLVKHSADQSIASSSWTLLVFDTELLDPVAMHDPVDSSKIVSPCSGWYELTGMVNFAANATGTRGWELLRNGVASGLVCVTSAAPSATDGTSLVLSGLIHLDANDYVQLRVMQSSGGAINVIGNFIQFGIYRVA